MQALNIPILYMQAHLSLVYQNQNYTNMKYLKSIFAERNLTQALLVMLVTNIYPLDVQVDLRKTVLLVSGLMAAGTVLRCGRKYINNEVVFLIRCVHHLIVTISHSLYSCHACAILNGISGVTVMAAPPIISSTWFPASERTTATAINQVICLSTLFILPLEAFFL